MLTAPKFVAARFATAALVAIALLRPGASSAEPMLCSGDFYKACLTTCAQPANKATAPGCFTNCRTLLQRCVQTSCWDGSSNRYCGLLRK